jgi:hypothetical protein
MDIIQLLNGLQEILHLTLNIKSEYGTAVEMTEEQRQKYIASQLEILNESESSSGGFFDKIFGSSKKKDPRDTALAHAERKIYKVLHEIIVAAINCWTNKPLLKLRNFHFTRSGMFTYHPDDGEKSMELLNGFYKREKNVCEETEQRDFILFYRKARLEPISK